MTIIGEIKKKRGEKYLVEVKEYKGKKFLDIRNYYIKMMKNGNLQEKA